MQPWPRRVVIVLRALLIVALIRTAWLCDDAYISFRTADNILNGFGPVWNVGERVQAYTHPLWMWLCTLVFAITGEVYFSAIALCVAVTAAAVTILVTRLAATPGSVAVCFAALVSSKAFLDYSTSGLENPLAHLLILLVAWLWWEAPATTRSLRWLALLASAIMLTRTDLALVAWLPVAHLAWRVGPRAAVLPLVIGFAPLVAWEAFSLFYYGLLVPNTAVAKLGSAGPSWGDRFARGVLYFKRTATQDPVTLPVIAAAIVVAARERPRDLVLLGGVVMYLGYVVNIGGDFMMGRFFSVPFVLCVAVLVRSRWLAEHWRPAVAAIVLAGLASPWEPAMLSGFGYDSIRARLFGQTAALPPEEIPSEPTDLITDERRWYYEELGLFEVVVRGGIAHRWRDDGVCLRESAPSTVTRGNIGLSGFYAGPRVHIIDVFGLSDPVTARLPSIEPAHTLKVGHYRRPVPAGYVDTIASSENRIVDRNLAAYYDALHTVVAGPLWSRQRLRTILDLQLGRYDHYRDAYLEWLKTQPIHEIRSSAVTSPCQ